MDAGLKFRFVHMKAGHAKSFNLKSRPQLSFASNAWHMRSSSH